MCAICGRYMFVCVRWNFHPTVFLCVRSMLCVSLIIRWSNHWQCCLVFVLVYARLSVWVVVGGWGLWWGKFAGDDKSWCPHTQWRDNPPPPAVPAHLGCMCYQTEFCCERSRTFDWLRGLAVACFGRIRRVNDLRARKIVVKARRCASRNEYWTERLITGNDGIANSAAVGNT